MLFSVYLAYRPCAEDFEDEEEDALFASANAGEEDDEEFGDIPLIQWVVDEPSLDAVMSSVDEVGARLKRYAIEAARTLQLIGDDEEEHALLERVVLNVEPCAIHSFARILEEIEELNNHS